MVGAMEGRVCVVTGAGRGLGREHARLLASEGAWVVVNDVGCATDGTGADPGVAAAVAEEITRRGGRAVADAHSSSAPAGARAVMDVARSAFGRVDVLVQSAGIQRNRAALDLEPSDWDDVLSVQLGGSYWCAQAFAREVKAQGTPGSIVFTSSPSGLMGQPGHANLAAAAGGLWGLTRTLALEWEKYRIRVNAVAPVALTRLTEHHPWLRHARDEDLGPQHVSPVVVYLASTMSSGVTGRVLGVQGRRVFEYRMNGAPGIQREEGTWTAKELKHRWQDLLG